MASRLMLAALLLLPACRPAEPPAAPQAATAASAAAPDARLAQQLERIERSGRARSHEQEQLLQALQASTRPGSAERLEVLSLRGVLAGYNLDHSTLEDLRAQLRDWPTADSRRLAELASATMLAMFDQGKGDLREALKALEPQRACEARGRPELVLLRACTALLGIQVETGQVEQALISAQLALGMAEARNEPWRRALALNELARVHFRAQQLEPAERANAEALRLAGQDHDPVLMTSLTTMRGIIHAEDADPSITEQAWAASLRHAREAQADSLVALALANYSDHFLRQSDFNRALELAAEALPLARRTHNLNAEIIALHNQGVAKIGLKRVEEGKRDVRQAIRLDEQQGALPYAADGWQELGTYLERAGDWDGAIEAHHTYRRMIDQVLRDDTRKAMLEVQKRFDAERHARDIELLDRDNRLMTEQIHTQQLELKLWAVLAGCVVISTLLLTLAYQRIRRSNAALARSNEQLKTQSERDPLTGLANRRHFHSAIKRMADAGNKLSGTVYLIDIDHFKRINDQWGHAAGDRVLAEVARRLSSALREVDLVVRWGGEEFLIVVPSQGLAEPGRALAQRLLDLLAGQPVQHGRQRIAVSASIGFASFPLAPHGLSLSWERAIDLVDTVMYLAKAHGRNKAYGVRRLDARDEAALARLSPRIEAAWQEGRVELVSLQGPSPEAAA